MSLVAEPAASVTATLAALLSETPARVIPAAVREVARRAVLDTVGVAVAGANEDCVRIVRSVALADGSAGQGRATVGGIHIRHVRHVR